MATIVDQLASSPTSTINRSDVYDLGDITLQSNSTNTDYIGYYSSDYDRDHRESSPNGYSGFAGIGVDIPGIPRTGLYALDGLWDEDDTISDSTTLRPASGSTVGTGSKQRQSSRPTPPTLSANGSVRSRGRSGTISSVSNGHPGGESKDDKAGLWIWSRKSNPTTPNMPESDTVPQSQTLDVKEKRESRVSSLRKERSKSRLRGKGRKGELTVAVNDPDESFEAPPPVPPTPASFLTASSPALSTGSLLSPRQLPSRMLFDQENSPLAPATVEGTKSAKSSWKRGMEKIFRSKSSAALREAFSMADPNQPAVPRRPDGLPKSHEHPLGPAFSSSTPPMPSHDSQKETWGLYGSLYSPPTTATSTTFGFTQPSLPHDPFASSMDMSSSHMPRSPLLASPPSRQSLSRNSPSLRDLKNFLAPKSQLTKAKSLANIRDRISEPISAPLQQGTFAEEPLPAPRVPKRVKSAMSLNSGTSVLDAISENAALHPLPRPNLARMPTESPPLMAPHPPFFSTPSTQQSAPSSPGAPSATTDLSLGPMTPPPSTPLPAPPASSPMTQTVSSPVKRSASGAILLPRSRSTSMSLKAPPTSSSFFDLYEQLGIWPTSSSDKSITREPSTERTEDRSPDRADSAELRETVVEETVEATQGNITTISESPSAAFSLGSWEAAISAFPMVEDEAVPRFSDVANSSMDFGEPIVGDQHGVDNLLTTSPLELIDEPQEDISDTVMERISNCSSSQVGNQSANAPSGQAGTSSTANKGASSSSYTYSGGMSRGRTALGGSGGSEHSSRGGSRDERHRDHARGRRRSRRGSSTSSSDDDNEEDDLPLSRLHPQAAAQQRGRADRKAAKRSTRTKSHGRNPGAGSGWNGEGGVPSDVLTSKLQALQLKNEERRYPWQLAAAGGPSRHRILDVPTRPVPTAVASAPAQKSRTEPIQDPKQQSIERSRERQPSVQSNGPDLSGRTRVLPSPLLVQGLQQVPEHGAARLAPARYSANGSPASQVSHHVPTAIDLSRNSTQRSAASATKSRSRHPSNADSLAPPSDTTHRRATTEPVAPPKRAVHVPAIIGHLGGPHTILEVFQDTTAKDILHLAQHRGQLAQPGPGLGWVVVEIFGELGCERHIREYENVQSIVQGWDQSGKNTLLLCQSNRAVSTWTKSIPSAPPFLGCYVQSETKKGKWSKKYLETRGGQVFLAKNEKNKDEVQLNTLFHDVYSMPRPKGAPKPFVFTMKRMEPANTFADMQEYTHTFSTDEQIGWKLFAAIYDAKSAAMAQNMPQIMAPISSAPMPRKRTETEGSAPLVDLIKEKKEERSGFTGKGLLKF